MSPLFVCLLLSAALTPNNHLSAEKWIEQLEELARDELERKQIERQYERELEVTEEVEEPEEKPVVQSGSSSASLVKPPSGPLTSSSNGRLSMAAPPLTPPVDTNRASRSVSQPPEPVADVRRLFPVSLPACLLDPYVLANEHSSKLAENSN